MTDVDPRRCPLCGRGNACAMAQPGGACTACWCRDVVVDRQALARVPAAAADRACLCADCARGTALPPPAPTRPHRP